MPCYSKKIKNLNLKQKRKSKKVLKNMKPSKKQKLKFKI